MGKNWAIVVGINNYDNLQPLKYAQRDAEAMQAWFKDEAKFDQVFLFTEDSPSIPTNPPIPTQPTQGRFKRFLNAQFDEPLLKPEDNLWFFFAGHGKRFIDQDYLMFLDSDPTDHSTAISVDYVTQRLRRCGADNVVLLIDACRDEGDRSGLGVGMQEHKGVITFYSCTANQKSWEIDELQHGSFTYSLLEGLRLQGESNCATVERLEQHLRYQVPQLNNYYKKSPQNPSLKAEPPYKMYYILLEQAARLKDLEPLKYQASLAENRGELALAKQLWVRVLAASRGDLDAIDAIERIALRQRGDFKQIVSLEPATSLSGDRSINPELLPVSSILPQNLQEAQLIQTETEKQQFLQQYEQKLTRAIEIEYPLNKTVRNELKQFQQLKKLRDEDIALIERRLLTPKQTEYERQQKEAQRLRQEQAGFQKRQLELREQERQEIEKLNQELEEFQQLRKRRPKNTSKSPSLIQISQLDFSYATLTIKTGFLGVGKRNCTIEHHRGRAEFFTEHLENHVTLEMVAIPSGNFLMGSSESEEKRSKDESPQHIVEIKSFFIGKYPITQKQYEAIMGENPSFFQGARRPVEQVSWDDAVEFCTTLSQETGRNYRLPTEAEWEYACRAGTSTPFYYGETITTDLGNYNGSYTYGSAAKGGYHQQTTDVGSFPANIFGLYDMHGNVWEWCQDSWHGDYNKAPTDGTAWIDKIDERRLLRGGSWHNNPQYCRSACRLCYTRDKRPYHVGFRVVCDHTLSPNLL